MNFVHALWLFLYISWYFNWKIWVKKKKSGWSQNIITHFYCSYFIFSLKNQTILSFIVPNILFFSWKKGSAFFFNKGFYILCRCLILFIFSHFCRIYFLFNENVIISTFDLFCIGITYLYVEEGFPSYLFVSVFLKGYC